MNADLEGERLDVFLTRTVEGLTRAKAQTAIAEGLVTLQGRKAKKNDKCKLGDVVTYEYREAVPVDIQPVKMDLNFVYEDEDVVVIDKPKGLVVHPAAGHENDTLVNGLMYALGDKLSGINGELRPGIVHRIDKDTSGLLAVAKNDTAHVVLASQLVDHTVHEWLSRVSKEQRKLFIDTLFDILEASGANTIKELLMSAEYIMAGGNENIILCERGIRTFETYTRNTLDLSAVPVLKELTHLPVVIDPSHATGKASLVPSMALAATAAGADGLMIEVHNDPAKAKCDGAQSLTPRRFAELAGQVLAVKKALCT
jgi:ribosomal 50S subunit-recycling heat shock protein